MSLLELGQRKAATQEELNKLKKDLDTTKNKVTTNTNNLTNLTERTVSLETNAAKKNTTNTFTQKQTFRNEVEFGTTIKAGFGGGLINFTPEDNSSKTLKLQRLELDLSDKKIVNVATPTTDKDCANKKYVDDKNSITLTNITEQINNVNTTLTNEINAIKQVNNTQNTEINDIKQKNSEQDTQINNIIQINTTQTNDISSIKTKNTQQDNRLTNIENTNTTQSNQISGIDNRVTTLENTTVGDLSRLTQRVTNNESRLDRHGNSIYALEQKAGDIVPWVARSVTFYFNQAQKITEYTDIGGLDITVFDWKPSSGRDDEYIIAMTGAKSNVFLINHYRILNGTYRLYFAKKARTNYPSYIELGFNTVGTSRIVGRVNDENTQQDGEQ